LLLGDICDAEGLSSVVKLPEGLVPLLRRGIPDDFVGVTRLSLIGEPRFSEESLSTDKLTRTGSLEWYGLSVIDISVDGARGLEFEFDDGSLESPNIDDVILRCLFACLDCLGEKSNTCIDELGVLGEESVLLLSL
jgi:hypothetical protein